MAQNRSSAIMAQRHRAPNALDHFPTPPWATRALCEWLRRGESVPLADQMCWEPACAEGHMARTLGEYFGDVRASDVHDHGWSGMEGLHDFLMPGPPVSSPDWIITNPPFLLAGQFIAHARALALRGVAMLVRTSFLEGARRWREVFDPYPPRAALQFSERVIMARGVLRDPAVAYWDADAEKLRKPSTATAYCWLVWSGWDHEPAAPVLGWIPPGTRARLECPGDYPAPAAPEPGAHPAMMEYK